MIKEQMTLVQGALDILGTHDAAEKAQKTRALATAWARGDITELGQIEAVPDRPQRPEKPALLMPRDMPKRKRGNSVKNRVALLHALAHIELNAIDLAWDMMARFSGFYADNCQGHAFTLPLDFYTDWLKVADDEAKHFLLLSGRLNDFGAAYGDLPAHDGLWESAYKTRHSLPARLVVVPMGAGCNPKHGGHDARTG